MSATLYCEHRVFKAAEIEVNDGVLFSGSTVIVAGNQCENNVHPHSYSWKIEFIGSEDTFVKRYLPETAYFFDDGLSQAPYIANGKQFRAHLNNLYSKASQLDLSSLKAMGIYGYSWPKKDVELLGISKGLKSFSYYLGDRYGKVLEKDSDVEDLINQSYKMAPSHGKYIWLSSLWPFDLGRATALRTAEDGCEFKVF